MNTRSCSSVARGAAVGLVLVLLGPAPRIQSAIIPVDNVDPNPLTTPWTSTTRAYVGNTGYGALTVNAGDDVVSRYGYIGNAANVTGEVTITGGGSTWDNRRFMYVGKDGNGKLSIADGGSVTVSADGGYSTCVGLSAGSTGAVSVDGENSTWTTKYGLCVGSAGNGVLEITDGGTVATTGERSYIAERASSTSTATVDGENSRWTNNRNVYVGYSGKATLDVTRGGAVSTTDWSFVGYDRGSTGNVTVHGANSIWTTGQDLYVGHSGNGKLTVSNGGLVSVADTTYVAYSSGSTGMIDFGAGGGTLTTHTLWALPTQLAGAGTINAGGLVSDIDLRFDSSHGASHSFMIEREPGQHITVNLNKDTSWGDLGVGYRGNASMTVRDGVKIRSENSYLGYEAGSRGQATVTGAGSAWTTNSLSVGVQGDGSLNILDGAALASNCTPFDHIGAGSHSTGVVTVDGDGSVWTVRGQLAIGENGNGTVRITRGGRVIGHVNDTMAYAGYSSGAIGKIVVDGENSSWTSFASLVIGREGNGSLAITGGATVSDRYGSIGSSSSSYGVVLVDGSGSTWANTTQLTVGYSGTGILCIAGGGVAAAPVASINSQSLLAIDVGENSRLTVGDGAGTLTNNGVVRVTAGATPAIHATYTPIAAGTLTTGATGVWQALGGMWDPDSRVFEVSEVATAVSGQPVSVDLADLQRVLVRDVGTGWTLGASFLAMEDFESGGVETTMPIPTEISFTAAPMTDAALHDLGGLLEPGERILGGWELSADGAYASGDPAYLSFHVGAAFSRDRLAVWQFDGLAWHEFDAIDLTYDGSYANFTVTGLGCYAVTGVPEPATIALVLSTGFCLLVRCGLIRDRAPLSGSHRVG